jgi:prophage regulatory protein
MDTLLLTTKRFHTVCTIYEMERRGEFPRRFNLAPRCVVWDLTEVEAWIEQRRKDSDARLVSVAPSPDVRLRRTRPVKLHPQIDRAERYREKVRPM